MSFARNLCNKYRKNFFFEWVTKTGLIAQKTVSKKVLHPTVEATEEFLGNKIAEKTVNRKPVTDENSRNVEEIVISLEKRQELLNKLIQVS